MGRACGLIVLAVVVLLALGGSEARAGSASVQVFEEPDSGDDDVTVRVVVSAEPGEANDVTLARDGEDVLVRDSGAPLTPGSGCVTEGPQTVRCRDDRASPSVGVGLGDGHDRLLVSGDLAVSAGGGEGDDMLVGAVNTPARLDGGPGDDVLTGGDRNDLLFGGEGADRLVGGGGDDDLAGDAARAPVAPDVMEGGEGTDSVSYALRTEDIVVDLATDGPAGAPGEGDRLTSIEEVSGGEGDDVLRGGPGGDRLSGGRGGDVLSGSGGDDELIGGEDIDYVDGGEGDDRLVGGNRDTLEAGAGDDEIDINRVLGDDDVDGLVCGPGSDLVSGLPERRLLPEDCEELGLLALGTSRPRVVDGHPRLDVTRRSINPPTCRLRVEIRTFGGRLLARGAKRTADRDARVTAVLTATGRAVLRDREKPVRVEVTFRRARCSGGYVPAGHFRARL